MTWVLEFEPQDVEPILKGERKSTVRLERRGLYTGCRVNATVDNKPFAELQMTGCRLVDIASCKYGEAIKLKEQYPILERVWILLFKLVEPISG